MSRLALFTIALLPFAIACDDEPSEEGEDPIPSSSMPYCEDVETAMSADDVGSFGVSGADFLAQIPANAIGEAAFEGADASDLEVEITVDADSLRFVESTEVYPETDGPVPAIAVMCADRIEVNAQMALVTADGQLAETIDLVAVLVRDGHGRRLAELARVEGLDPATGDYRLTSLTYPTTGDPQ